MEYVLGVVAAALLGAGFVLQQDAAQQAPKAHFLRLQLLADLWRRPRWLAGLFTMVAGELLSAWVIGHMVLSLAEPLLATNLLFALLLAGPLSGQTVHRSEVIGALILMAGVTALSLARSVRSPQMYVGSYTYWPFAGAAVAFLALVCAELGRRRMADQRALLTGISAGLALGIADALTRRTVQIIDTGHFAVVLTSWPGYSLIGASLGGLWLMESAFNAAPLHTSLPGITAAEPLAGIVLGLVVFRDSLRVSPEALALEAAGLTALVIGVIMVARAPALGRLRRLHPPHHETPAEPANRPRDGFPPARAAPLRKGLRQRLQQGWSARRGGQPLT
ncbi:MAG TPA: DMT family transporter [Streptosporangiaceae bacterium]|nr:DMT family transporter [Streptosporangiaceae bacterium]